MDARNTAEQLSDMLSSVMEEAMRLKQSADESNKRLKTGLDQLTSAVQAVQRDAAKAAESVPGAVEKAIKEQLPSATKLASALMMKSLQDANCSAERAARAYSTSLQVVIWSTILVFALGVGVGAALAFKLLH